MLDTIFYFMAKDEYSKWDIHARKCSSGGNMEFTTPHFYCDGRSMVRAISPAFLNLSSVYTKYSIPASSVMKIECEKRVVTVDTQTNFQGMMSSLIDLHSWKDDFSIAVAVDISSVLEKDYGSKGNQVSFPIFKVLELRKMCTLDKKDWIRLLRARALEEFQNYLRVARALSPMSKNRRTIFYNKMPLFSVEAVVSYFGAIEKIINYDASLVKSLDFAVTATKGPRQVILGFSNGNEAFFRTIPSGRSFSWEFPVTKFLLNKAE